MSKILIIEDDIFFGEALVSRIKEDGDESMLVRDGVSGLNELREWKPNLVFMDLSLPQMDGYAILEQKQKDARIASIPVVAILSSEQIAEVKRVLKLGAKDYVVKNPLVLEEASEKARLLLPGSQSALSAVQNNGISFESLSAKESAPKLGGKKIMWVEDDKFLSDIIARKLSVQGCTLLHATEGEEALRIIPKERPDLILLDILLSGIDGFEILKRVKENPAIKDTPVILLSNLGQKEDIAKGKSLGAARFLVKATVTLDEIIDEMQKVLKETGGKSGTLNQH